MTDMQVAVVGGGPAGLNAARLLHRAGADVQLFEARDRLGGRVLTVDASGAPSDDGFDLGPSWFWPRMQPALATLVDELGLEAFAQRTDGDVVFERMSREPAQRYTAVQQDAASLRFAGGSATLVNALARTLPPERLRLGAVVTRMQLLGDRVRLSIVHEDEDEDGGETVEAEHVIAALPPRLLQATIDLEPAPSSELAASWRSTPTWMAPHAKFFALYERPFWLESGYSGTAQSMVGPMLEIHDATTRSGRAALFGFLGIGAQERRSVDEQALTDACIKQLVRLFGRAAATPTATLYKDWAADRFTATQDDPTSTGHPTAAAVWVDGPWKPRLLLAGSETSPTEAGYLAGAIEASRLAATEVQRRLDGAVMWS